MPFQISQRPITHSLVALMYTASLGPVAFISLASSADMGAHTGRWMSPPHLLQGIALGGVVRGQG